MPVEGMVYKVQYVDEEGNVVDEDIIINKTKVRDRILDAAVASAVGILVSKAVSGGGDDS